MLVHEFPFFLWLLKSMPRWHTQICNFRYLMTSVLQVCIDRDLKNAVGARWLDGKCQRLLATALKVQHCWTLKTTVGNCRWQSPTCTGDSCQLKYKHTLDYRRLLLSRTTAMYVSCMDRLLHSPHTFPGDCALRLFFFAIFTCISHSHNFRLWSAWCEYIQIY